VEAVAHLTQGLDVLMPLPDRPERDGHELALRLALGTSLSVTTGWPAPAVGQAYSRAQYLCQHLGETAQCFPVLWGLWHYHAVRGEPQTARELGGQLLTLARQHQEPTYVLAAHFRLGGALTQLGALAPALPHWEQTFALYDRQQRHALTDSRVTPLGGNELGIGPSGRDQVSVVPAGDHLPTVDHNDAVSREDSREPVCDDQWKSRRSTPPRQVVP
jgi:hypothetical protein